MNEILSDVIIGLSMCAFGWFQAYHYFKKKRNIRGGL